MKLKIITGIMNYKKILLYILISLPFSMFAKLWTVDNSPGAGADFTSVKTAHDAASSGDSIVVMPSFTMYDAVNINKKLFIYSRGHSSNTIDKDKRAIINTVVVYKDSVTLQGLYIWGGVGLYANNIKFQNNFTGSIMISGNNNLIQGNVFNNYNTINFSGNPQNNLVLNNFILFNVQNGSNFNGPSYFFINGGNSSNLVANNFIGEIISRGSIGSGGFNFFQNSYVKVYNNILWSDVPNRKPFDTLNLGSVFEKNLTYSVKNNDLKLPGDNYNDILPLFEGGYDSINLPIFRENNNLRLKSNSVGKNGGTDSTDVGLYGQGFNFSFEGNVPGVAVFTDFKVLNPVIKRGEILKVRVKAKKTKN